MKLVHVIPHISKEASGPSYSVPRLCQSLASLGNDVEISCLAARGEIPGVGVDVHFQWPALKKFAISPSHARALHHKAAQLDIVHNHSLWSMVNVAAGWVVPGRGAKLVTSPRGTLSEWSLNRNRWAKRILWPLQCRILARADLLHATSENEYREIRSMGFKAPVAIIPNGIDVPETYQKPVGDGTQKTLLFLSRIHPKKGIDRLLHVWSKLEGRFPQWRLVVVGKGDPAHEQEVQLQAQQLGLQRAIFPGPLYGVEKSSAYIRADLFVLPTHSENFGMVVAEALSYGCPTVVSKGAPWAGLEIEHCGWWIEQDVNALEATLELAMCLTDAERQAMGKRGRDWMKREFGWSSIAQRMNDSYKWICWGGEPLAWIRID